MQGPSGKTFAHRGLVPMLGPNGSADRECSSVITFWTFENFLKKCPTERPTDRGISRPAGREILADCVFQRNHLLDFVKISKYFKVRSGKRRAHEGSRPSRSTRLVDCGIFQRNHLLDFVKISKYFKRSAGRSAIEESSRPGSRETFMGASLPTVDFEII